MRLVLDTNVHSDWANDPCMLSDSERGRLGAVLNRSEVELLVPIDLLVEFRWPVDKQERWYVRVGQQAQRLRLIKEDVVRWEAKRALASLQGLPQAPEPLHDGKSSELYEQLRSWHPSGPMTLVTDLLETIATLQRTSSPIPSEVRLTPTAANEVLRMLQSPAFAADVSAAMREMSSRLQSKDTSAFMNQFVSVLARAADDGEVVGNTTTKEVLASLRALFSIRSEADTMTVAKFHRYSTIRGLLPAEVSDDDVRKVFRAFEAGDLELPGLAIHLGISDKIRDRLGRRAKASDFIDLRVVPTLIIADYVTTDADMKATYESLNLPPTRGALYSRNEIPRMLDEVEAYLSAGG